MLFPEFPLSTGIEASNEIAKNKAANRLPYFTTLMIEAGWGWVILFLLFLQYRILRFFEIQLIFGKNDFNRIPLLNSAVEHFLG